MMIPFRPSLRFALLAAAAVFAALPCNQAKAQTSTWLNAGSGSWLVNTNWSDTTIPYQYQSALITNGGTAVIASGSTGEAYGLQLGNSGTGSVVNNGTLRIDYGTLGQSVGDYGAYLGTGGSWYGSSVNVGASGRGEVSLTAGSYAQINFLQISTGTTGQGSVSLSGTSQLDASYFSVGAVGSGTLTLQDKSRLTGDTLIIGGGNLGAATVNRSSVTTSYELSVGYSGSAVGSLSITNSGTVSGGNVFIGRSGGAEGTVTVSGSGSRFSAAGLSLAQSGSSTGSLTVQSGGIVSTTDTSIAGDGAGQGSVVVKDAGSIWTNTNSLVIGSGGTGSVAIQNGGTGSSGSATLGSNANSVGTLTVTGNGSKFAVGGQLSVGNLGTGTLSVANGGVVSSGSTFVGGKDSSVIIDGAGSQLIADNFATGISGASSSTNTVTVQNGGRLTSNNVSLSYGPVTNATVTGAGSIWTATNTFYIAIFNDASLSVTNGGVVEAGFIRKGDPSAPDGHAGTLSLDGGTLRALQDSALISNFADGAVSIGAGGGTIDTNGHSIAIASNLGGSGLLSQTGGGEMRFTKNQDNAVSLAVRSGTFTVDGNQASIASSGSLIIGQAGGDKALGELIFRADVLYSNVVIGDGVNSSGTLNVRNESTLKTYDDYYYPIGSIIVGKNGTGRLDISEASQVRAGGIVLGSGSTGLGVLSVDNSTIDAPVTVGWLGSGSMSITNGGKVTGGGSVGTGANTYSGVLVDGAGSVWSSSTLGINVGINGTTVSNVINGGALENLSAVGYLAGQSILRVAGNGSRIVGNSFVGIGLSGTGTLIVEDGATFTGSSVLLGNVQGSYGSLFIYTNAASATMDSVMFGASGSSQLYLAFGGSLKTNTATLAAGSTARADALVDGDGTVWDSEIIYVGTSGTANLSIARNAVVNVGSGTGVLYLGSGSTSVGTLTIGSAEGEDLTAAGTLNAAAIQGGSGTGLVKFNHTGSISFAPTLSGSLKVQNRAGTTLLSGSNNYNGGTLVNGGTLAIANNNAVGTGGVTVETGGVFLVKQGFSATNHITLNGGLYQHQIALGGDLTGAIVASTDLGIYGPTSAAILDGTASAATTLSASFSAGDGPLSAVLHLSGVPVVSGQRTDIFVLELSMSSIEHGSYLAWLNGEDEWVNAVLGNFGNNARADQQGFDGGFAEFQAIPGNGTDLATYIGAWGFTDTSVWAVLNHNSDFGVVPEPASLMLVVLGLGALAPRRRKARAN